MYNQLFVNLNDKEKNEITKSINAKLEKLGAQVKEMEAKDAAYDSLDLPAFLQGDVTQKQANTLRHALFVLRQQMDEAQSNSLQEKSFVAKRKICDQLTHAVLILLSRHWPLNPLLSSERSELTCPITRDILGSDETITLSNGCYYALRAFKGESNKRVFRDVLPGSRYPITKADQEEIDKGVRRTLLGNGISWGGLTGLGLTSLYFSTSGLVGIITGTTLTALGTSALVGLGLSAMAAGLVMALPFFLPLVAGLVIGTMIAVSVYKRHYAVKLNTGYAEDFTPDNESLSTTRQLGKTLGSSNSQSHLDKLDTGYAEGFISDAPAVTNSSVEEKVASNSSDEDELIIVEDSLDDTQPLLAAGFGGSKS